MQRLQGDFPEAGMVDAVWLLFTIWSTKSAIAKTISCVSALKLKQWEGNNLQQGSKLSSIDSQDHNLKNP